jgi:DNA-binding response OmpR family regulator
MLTGKGDLIDRVVGLETGADDYVPKPFDLREVLARIRGVMRRTGPLAAPVHVYQEISVNPFGCAAMARRI